METANIQSVVENNIVSVALMNIQPSSYNPRKHFDEVSLAELAESIRQQGVLQPIGVRPIADTDRFEIVFGEQVSCRPYGRTDRDFSRHLACFGRDRRRNGRDGESAAQGRYPHRGSQRLPKTYGERSL